jgi:dipeptidyl aminopeptidase/acylaminoacyl peptidase
VGDPVRAAAQISPDGKKLAYVARDRRGVLTLWVQTIDREDEQPATTELDRPLRLPTPVTPRVFAWQSDNRHLLFLLDENGDEMDHLQQVNVETGKLRDLTPFKGVRAQSIPGGEKYPDTALVAMNYRDRKHADAYRIDLDTGKVTEVARNPGDVSEWFANNRGEVVAAQAVDLAHGTTELRIRSSETEPWRSALTVGAEEVIGTTFSSKMVCGFSPDDRRIRLALSEGFRTSRLVEMDVKPSEGGCRPALETLDEDADADVGGLLVNPQTGEVDAVWGWKERREWTLLNPEVSKDFDLLGRAHSGDIQIESRDRADRRWIVSYTTDLAPPVFYFYDRDEREAVRLFSTQPDLETSPTAPTKPISLKARDGLTLKGYLTLPQGLESKGLPLVLLVHGGPHLRDLWSFNGWVQLLANRGYAVLQVNFRGSSGFGKAHLHAGDREWGRKMLDDLVDAKRWAVERGLADERRCAIAGFSYGGYAALSALAFAPGEFVCGVAAAAPCDLVSLVRSIPPEWLSIRALVAHRLGDAEKDRAALKEASPLEHVEKITAPLLLGHGEKDPRVPIADSKKLAESIKASGRDVQFLSFANDGHNWARSSTRIRWAEALEKFLAKHLGGRVEEDPSEDLLPHAEP